MPLDASLHKHRVRTVVMTMVCHRKNNHGLRPSEVKFSVTEQQKQPRPTEILDKGEGNLLIEK